MAALDFKAIYVALIKSGAMTLEEVLNKKVLSDELKKAIKKEFTSK